MTELPFIASARRHADRTAIVAAEGTFTYQQLLDATDAAARRLLAARPDLGEGRVAFLVPPGWHHVVTQWAIWRAGGVAVPLALMHPPPELDYVIGDSGASIVVAHPSYEAVLRPLAEARGVRLISTTELVDAAGPQPSALPAVAPERRALIVYTSGTTGRPKGVVTSHAVIEAQAQALLHAWEWSRDDRILHVLPLHHVHGILNVLFCALRAGALCELMPRFDAEAVWERFAVGDLSLFMAVPTVYARLIQAWQAAPPERQAAFDAGGFWQRRAPAATPSIPLHPPAPATRLTLAPDLQFTTVPVAGASHVTRHDGVKLRDKVYAFIGEGVPVAPLLQAIDGPTSAFAVVQRWSQTLPATHALELLRWAWAEGLLCPAA